VFLTTGVLSDNQTEDIQYLIGYKVFIQGDKLIGSIKEVIPNSGQWLLNIISSKNKEILIPFHEHFIVITDKRKKIIVMNIPEGLIEIN
jgi:16S rRNA processing protein RimM